MDEEFAFFFGIFGAFKTRFECSKNMDKLFLVKYDAWHKCTIQFTKHKWSFPKRIFSINSFVIILGTGGKYKAMIITHISLFINKKCFQWARHPFNLSPLSFEFIVHYILDGLYIYNNNSAAYTSLIIYTSNISYFKIIDDGLGVKLFNL